MRRLGWMQVGKCRKSTSKKATVTFKKVRNVAFKKSKQKKLEITQPFTPVPVHRPRSKIPSNTKVSKLYARIKNLERQRAMPRQPVRGIKFKSSQYQKRLYKNDEKPK